MRQIGDRSHHHHCHWLLGNVIPLARQAYARRLRRELEQCARRSSEARQRRLVTKRCCKQFLYTETSQRDRSCTSLLTYVGPPYICQLCRASALPAAHARRHQKQSAVVASRRERRVD
jgi:hypothetical protein